MGYPMTWQRLVHRNALIDGDYGAAALWAHGINVQPEHDTVPEVARARREGLDSYQSRISGVMGDMRRLERDTVDEGYICQEIARRTGADPELVAAVLKEWLAV